MTDDETSVPRNRLANNVGWQLWNFSKRVSSARSSACIAREQLESCRGSTYWRSDELDELEWLTVLLEECAERAMGTWDALRNAQVREAPELVKDDRGVAVISAGENPELLERLRVIYRAGRVSEYGDLMDELKRLIVRVERRHSRELGRVIAAAFAQRRLTDNLLYFKSFGCDRYRERRGRRIADKYDFSVTALSQVRQLTVRLEDCADRARIVRARLQEFIRHVDPPSSLWCMSSTLESQVLVIRANDTTLAESRYCVSTLDESMKRARRPPMQ